MNQILAGSQFKFWKSSGSNEKTHLVGGLKPSEKMKVSWDDHSQYMER
jgi:hypothetical protein